MVIWLIRRVFSMQALESWVGEPVLSIKDKMIPIKIYLCLVKCAFNPNTGEVHISEALASPFYCVSKTNKAYDSWGKTPHIYIWPPHEIVIMSINIYVYGVWTYSVKIYGLSLRIIYF